MLDLSQLCVGCQVGSRQAQRALAEGRVETLLLAEDADANLQQKFISLCQSHGVNCLKVPSKVLLGQACGIEVGAAVAVIPRKDAESKG